MKPIAEADKFDIAKYLRCIRDHHTQPRVYTPDSAAMDKFSECKAKLQIMVEASDRGYVSLFLAFS